MTRFGSQSDIDRSTAANDSRPSVRPHLLRLVTIVNVEQASSPHYPRSFLLQPRIHRYGKPGRGGPVSRQAGSPLSRSTYCFKYAFLPRGLGPEACLAHSYKGASPLVESPKRWHTLFGTPRRGKPRLTTPRACLAWRLRDFATNRHG